MTEEIDNSYEASPKELLEHDAQMSQIDEFIEHMQAQGWTWSEADRTKRELRHPDDPEVSIWFDPYTGEEFLSPKLAEQLRKKLADGSTD